MRKLLFGLIIFTACTVKNLDETNSMLYAKIGCLVQDKQIENYHDNIPGYFAVNHENIQMDLFYGHANPNDDLEDCKYFIRNKSGYWCQKILWSSIWRCGHFEN